tara:strand:+ start:638 stop:1189 length:552 start_codon:yes stop_codon:yes gene_type:complete
MSSSNSNLPVIILVVIAILALGGFYYADRSSRNDTDIAAITDSADTESMISSKNKYEADKSAFSHSGYTGSAEGYLSKYKDGAPKPAKVVKQHSGYSGSANDYVSKHNSDEIEALEENTKSHTGFSGSMKDYAAGKFNTRSTSKSNKADHSASPKSASKSSHANSSPDTGYKGSVNDYLDKYK